MDDGSSDFPSNRVCFREEVQRIQLAENVPRPPDKHDFSPSGITFFRSIAVVCDVNRKKNNWDISSQLTFVTKRLISDNSKDLTPRKPAKRGPKPKEGSANDKCRLCFINLKQKFGDFEKSLRISTANLFKPATQAGCQNKDTLADFCSRIGLDVVKSSTLSERVCQSCARKARNAVQPVHEFIASSLNRSTGESQLTISNFLQVKKRREDSSVFFQPRFPLRSEAPNPRKATREMLVLKKH